MLSVSEGQVVGAGSPARRLRFTAVEWAVLVSVAACETPPPFAADLVVSPAERVGALTSLTEARAIEVASPAADDTRADPSVTPALSATLHVLTRPDVVCDVRVAGRGRGRRAWLAITDGRGSGLVSLGDGAVEVSAFEAQALPAELTRLVPPVRELRVGGSALAEALAAGEPPPPPGGVVPLDALAHFETLRDLQEPPGASTAERWSPAERRLARELTDRLRGSVTVHVLGWVADLSLVGRTTWLGCDGGWVGLRPFNDAAGRQMLRVVPTRPAALGAWVAPHVREVMESVHGG